MQILAFETSAKAASVALVQDRKLLGESYQNTGMTHSQTLMVMAEDLLHQCGVTVSQLDGVAVANGPGSFTGLRIGVAAVKGMAQVLDKPCAPVSALEGLAFNLSDRTGILCPALDARCGQVYTAWFDADHGMKRLHEDCALMTEDLCHQLAALPPELPITLLGDGAHLVLSRMEELYPQRRLLLPGKHLLLQHAHGVGLAALHGIQNGTLQTVSPQQLVPVYLKLPQAQRELQMKLSLKKTEQQ